MKKFIISMGALVCALTVAPVTASADVRGVSTANVNMRSGPGTNYPAVTVIPNGTSVTIHGCLDTVNWCDVSFRRGRGWVSGNYVQAVYRSNRVFVGPSYYRNLGIPTITFDLGGYWDRHYRDRDFYRDRDRWRGPPARFDRDDRRPPRFDRDDRRPPQWGRDDRRDPPPRFDRDDRRPPQWDRGDRREPQRPNREDWRDQQRFDREDWRNGNRQQREENRNPPRFDREQPRLDRDDRRDPPRIDREERRPEREIRPVQPPRESAPRQPVTREAPARESDPGFISCGPRGENCQN